MSTQKPLPPGEKVGFLADLVRDIRLSWKLMGDGRVPLWVKAVPLVALAYLVLPIDLIPDPALGLGQLDDLAVLLLGLKLFVTLSPGYVVDELTYEIRYGRRPPAPAGDAPKPAETIDASYRVADGKGPGAGEPPAGQNQLGKGGTPGA